MKDRQVGRELEASRRRAYALRARLKELGHEISISHCYEIMATSEGHRNWPTMKTKIVEGDARGIVVGATTGSGQFDGGYPPSDIPIRIPFAKCLDHMEIIGSSKDFHVDTALGILRGAVASGWGAVFVNTTGDPAFSARLRGIARELGRKEDFRHVDLKRPETDQALAYPSIKRLSDIALDDHGSHRASWELHQRIALHGATAGMVWSRDHGKVVLDVASISKHLGLLGMIDLMDMERHPEMPIMIRSGIRHAIEAIPQNFRPEMGHRQGQQDIERHRAMMSGVFDLIADVVEYPKGSHSFVGLRPLLLDAVRDGRIVAIDIPRTGKWNSLGEAIARLVFDDLVDARKQVGQGAAAVPTVGAFTEAFGSVSSVETFDDKLRMASEAGCCLVLASDVSMPYPSLKRATTIHGDWGTIVSDSYSCEAETGDEAVREVLAGRDARSMSMFARERGGAN